MTLRDVIRQLQDTTAFACERERCVALHNFVRDEIAFGFTVGFEGVSPEQTLAARRGHCNAQADLFRALLEAVDIPARLRFVQIAKETLFGAVPPPVYFCLPTTLFHAVTQVRVAGAWSNTDSYILQPAAFARQMARLLQTGRALGFGLTRSARCEWEGTTDSFAQALASDLHEGNPVFASLADALAAKAGNNRLFGIHFNRWLACVPPALNQAGERYLNSRLEG